MWIAIFYRFLLEIELCCLLKRTHAQTAKTKIGNGFTTRVGKNIHARMKKKMCPPLHTSFDSRPYLMGFIIIVFEKAPFRKYVTQKSAFFHIPPSDTGLKCQRILGCDAVRTTACPHQCFYKLNNFIYDRS